MKSANSIRTMFALGLILIGLLGCGKIFISSKSQAKIIQFSVNGAESTASTSSNSIFRSVSGLRGANYVRLSPVDGWHSTFGVDRYDAARAQKALNDLAASGYNSVRVFIDVTSDTGTSAKMSAPGINEKYLNNLFDFLRYAQSKNIFVIITSQWSPQNYAIYYKNLSNGVGGLNGMYLNPQHVNSNIKFFEDLAKAIQGASLANAVLAFDLHNEGEFRNNESPLNSRTGTFKAPNGKSYSLASADERQAMLDDAVIHWINLTAAAIHSQIPNVLITQSVFSPFLVRGTERVAFRLVAIEKSSVDYLDAHIYAQNTSDIDTEIAELGVRSLVQQKPMIVGEMGFLSNKSVAEGDSLIRATYQKTCQSGFSGWLFWTWDSDEQTDWRNLVKDNGALNGVFAPVARACTHI
ncbi:MAG: hypothetical protein WCI18_11400 [Pseudomonadota bacterium]